MDAYGSLLSHSVGSVSAKRITEARRSTRGVGTDQQADLGLNLVSKARIERHNDKNVVMIYTNDPRRRGRG